MKLLFFGARKKSDEEKAQEQALKQQKKEEKARLAELKKQQKAHNALARKAAKEEEKRVARQANEWKKQEKLLREHEKRERRRVEKHEKQERKRVKKLERQHATARRRAERRQRKQIMRNRRKLKKLQKKQRRAQDSAVRQREVGELLAAIAPGQSTQTQDPLAAVTRAMVPPAFKKRQSCFTCRSRFRISRIRHHCRNCGESCCRKCLSSTKRPIPWQGKHAPQKICVMCDALVFSDCTAASLAAGSAAAVVAPEPLVAATASATHAPPRSNSGDAPEVTSSPAAAPPSANSRPASGSGIAISLSSRSRRLHRNGNGSSSSSSSSSKSKKPSLWTLPIRPLLKRKRSIEQLRNRQLDFELQLEKAAQLSRQGQRSLEIETQPQYSTLAAPLARAS